MTNTQTKTHATSSFKRYINYLLKLSLAFRLITLDVIGTCLTNLFQNCFHDKKKHFKTLLIVNMNNKPSFFSSYFLRCSRSCFCVRNVNLIVEQERIFSLSQENVLHEKGKHIFITQMRYFISVSYVHHLVQYFFILFLYVPVKVTQTRME